jgi:PGF-CTERM protein
MRSRSPATNDAEQSEHSYLWPSLPEVDSATAIALLAIVAMLGVGVTGNVAAVGSPAFDDATVTLTENESATIAIDAGSAETVELAIGGSDRVGYELNATVTPDEDGDATLVFDHTATATDADSLTAKGDANVEIDTETELPGPLDPASYDMRLSVANETQPTDIAALVVETKDTDEKSDADETTERQPIDEEIAREADIVVEKRGSQRVTVPTEVDDGTDVSIRIQSSDTDSAFLRTRDVSVENGKAAAMFDFSSVNHGTTATAHVRYDGGEAESVDILVVDPDVGVSGVDDLDELDGKGERNGENENGTDMPADPDSDDQTPDESPDDQPGFGAVIALLALSAAALLAHRST